MKIKVIITGATGMVGEGVLLECLAHPQVEQVLMVNRRPYPMQHPKLKECIVPDFFSLDAVAGQLTGYDGCLYCAGISSRGMKEAEYSRITYDTPLYFAQRLAGLNPGMIFSHISGSHTDSSEKGKIMWARVKGKTENDLVKLPFKQVFNFRPGIVKPTKGLKNTLRFYKYLGWLFPFINLFFSKHICTLRELGLAMIYAATKGYNKQILEVKDIVALSKSV